MVIEVQEVDRATNYLELKDFTSVSKDSILSLNISAITASFFNSFSAVDILRIQSIPKQCLTNI